MISIIVRIGVGVYVDVVNLSSGITVFTDDLRKVAAIMRNLWAIMRNL